MLKAPTPSHQTGLVDTGTAAMAVLLLLLILASFWAGVFYEGRRVLEAAQQELQDAHQRGQRKAAWLQDQHAASNLRLQQHIAALQSQLSTDQGQANEKHQTANAGVRAGTVRVRVPIVSASCTASQPLPATGSAAAATASTHAQLEPAAAANLADIAHDGDAAIRELNACIAQYGAVQASLAQWALTLKAAEHAQTR